MPDQGVLLAAGWWFREFLAALPVLLPRWLGSWVVTLVVLIYSFEAIRPHVRPRTLQLDERVRAWARSLRWRENPDSDEVAPAVERVWLTWFFRFWTNFASAPSLSVLSLVVPIWFYYHGGWSLRDDSVYAGNMWAYHEGVWSQRDPIYAGNFDAELRRRIFQGTAWWLLPGLCFTGSMLLSYVSKRIFKRVRPPIESGAFGHRLVRDPSFPSGHSLTSFCFWSMMVVSLMHQGAPPFIVLALAAVALTIILLTGLSRIYMRVHFPSDVLGGWVIGTVWSCVCYLAMRGVLGTEY